MIRNAQLAIVNLATLFQAQLLYWLYRYTNKMYVFSKLLNTCT